MLACQRDAFEIPREVAYFDSAAYSPLPRVVRAAGEAGVETKARPWETGRSEDGAWAERARGAAARLIGAAVGDVAIVGAVSYGVAVAARNLVLAPGGRILLMQDEFPSLALVWRGLAAERGLAIEVVARPGDGDWTGALLAAIGREGAVPVALAALTPLHWSDGARVDLAVLAPALRAQGGALVVDATQAAGVVDIDVGVLQPDFLVFPTYKWLLGPYGLAFLYVSPGRQGGVPLEFNGGNHRDGGLIAGAGRFDRGERNDPVGLRMAATGMELVLSWGVGAIAGRLGYLTGLLAERLVGLGLGVLPGHLRAPHVLGVRLPGGMPAGLMAELAGRGVFASDRLGVLRVSPHVWADEADVERFGCAVREVWVGDRRGA